MNLSLLQKHLPCEPVGTSKTIDEKNEAIPHTSTEQTQGGGAKDRCQKRQVDEGLPLPQQLAQETPRRLESI